MKCKWYAAFEGVCTNGDCPYRGDTCPTSEHQEVCRYAEEAAPEVLKLKAPRLSAKELAKTLRLCDSTSCVGCALFEFVDCGSAAKLQAADMLEKLAAERDAKKQQWISVKDRPPEAGKILVTDGETVTISNGAWLYRTLDGKTRVPANYGAGLTVTHWMPRPVPPKEETND